MTLNDYQQLALRTFAHHTSKKEAISNGILGLCGESGEVADLWKKYNFHGHHLDGIKMMEELGDVLYYVAVTAQMFGFELEQVAQFNINKLKERYPQGFSVERSQQRIDVKSAENSSE